MLFPYLIVWTLLKVPASCRSPQIEGVWLGFGELVVLLAGGWTSVCLACGVAGESFLSFATGERGFDCPILSQFQFFDRAGAYHLCEETAALGTGVASFSSGLAYLTGVGQIACVLACCSRSFRVWRQQRKRE